MLDLGEDYLDLHLDELIASCIGDAEFKRGLVAVWSDYRVMAVDDFCRWPGEPGENDTCRQRDPEDVEQRLDRDERVRGYANRNDVSVADRRERIDAEKERSIEWLSREASEAGLERIGPQQQKSKREQSVDDYIRACNEANEPRPRNGQ